MYLNSHLLPFFYFSIAKSLNLQLRDRVKGLYVLSPNTSYKFKAVKIELASNAQVQYFHALFFSVHVRSIVFGILTIISKIRKRKTKSKYVYRIKSLL